MGAFFALLWFRGFDIYGNINWRIVAWALPVLCLFCVADAVIAHNHNHSPIFKNKWANLGVGCVISFFYGFPSFGWIPTHNMNHHTYNNRPGDLSITTRPIRKPSLLAEMLYPTVVSLTQTRVLMPFLKRRWQQGDKFMVFRAVVEYAFFYGVMITLFLIDWQKALLFAVIPQQIALFTIQSFNYLQHVETNADTDWNHSRNFTGKILNGFLFNNGYHTIHHEKPGIHWSLTPAAHAQIAANIEPRLNQPNAFTYWLRRFVLDPLAGRKSPFQTLPADLTLDTITIRSKSKVEYLPPEPGKDVATAAQALQAVTGVTGTAVPAPDGQTPQIVAPAGVTGASSPSVPESDKHAAAAGV